MFVELFYKIRVIVTGKEYLLFVDPSILNVIENSV